MTFDSVDALKSHILSKAVTAMSLAQERIYLIINNFVKQYYAEYSPSLYERTYQLFRSLVKSEIKQTADGCEAEIYFDLDALDYHMKRIHGVSVPNKGGSEAKTLNAAMHGSHGGTSAGTAIWDESLAVLKPEAINMLKKALIDAGITIK